MVLCNVRRVQFGENRNLLYDILHFVFCIFDIDDFDSYSLARSFIDSGDLLVGAWNLWFRGVY